MGVYFESKNKPNTLQISFDFHKRYGNTLQPFITNMKQKYNIKIKIEKKQDRF
jgi:hypothetical protein